MAGHSKREVWEAVQNIAAAKTGAEDANARVAL